ncbi:MAG TPA: DUF4388 domain-containing protein [Candidatus Polarisedimenticolia bacterium]|nr:DUF4388 domain-containing protein [Candidatus Polarisedimenticolia bacterium]
MAVTAPSGKIGPLTFPSLVQSLCAGEETGTLVVTRSTNDVETAKTLYLDKGRVVFASSTDPDDRLGQLFLRRGMIGLEALQTAAVSSTNEGKRLGGVLVQMKAIRPEDLVWGVTEQVRGIVVGLFSWTNGVYRFTPGRPSSQELITLKMSTADLVLSGIRSIESWSRIEAAAGEIATRYTTNPRFEQLARELTLSLEEWTLLSRCESGATLGQVCHDSTLPDFEVCRLVWGFMVVGLLRRMESTQTVGV